MNNKPRRKWSPKRKLQVVMETLQSDAKLAEIWGDEAEAVSAPQPIIRVKDGNRP